MEAECKLRLEQVKKQAEGKLLRTYYIDILFCSQIGQQIASMYCINNEQSEFE